MNRHLRKAVERDKRRNSYLISPICEEDASIIWELITALSRIEDATDIKVILEDWKYLKDSDIYESLLQWNLDHPEGIEDNEENKDGRKFIQFEDELIELSLIKTVTKFNHYSYRKNEMDYRIVLNKDFPESSFLNNCYFSYPTLDERDKKLKHLKKVLGKRIKIL